eukprot:TRINITY_DN1826_c0_g1_i1.p1 TRINITY_DN1826_c0_g1~~TRINITY_DN1826_c0_g1_i1.p1  ORF type:complete len:367 (+),score=70.31 TRINITY_DN1826_c0_g1_i1:1644-2744(+)
MSALAPIVIDSGSSTVKAGFGGYEAPRTIFLALVGRPRFVCMVGSALKNAYVGEEAMGKRGIHNVRSPIERGEITNWDDVEKLWHHAFYSELRVAPEEHPVLFTEDSLSSMQSREKITQIAFETFNVPFFYLADSSVMALLNTGRTSGLVLDSGGGATRAVSVFEGRVRVQNTRKMDFGGIYLSELVRNPMCEKTAMDFFTYYAGKDEAGKIKCQYGYVAQDYEIECKSTAAISHTLPDGNSISIEQERFMVGEALFRPSLAGSDSVGVHELTRDAIGSQEEKNSLWKNIVLAGGNTQLPGFAQRLHKELTAMKPDTPKIKIIENQSKDYGVFLGGSIFTCLSQFPIIWIDKEKYDEVGPAVVHFL